MKWSKTLFCESLQARKRFCGLLFFFLSGGFVSHEVRAEDYRVRDFKAYSTIGSNWCWINVGQMMIFNRLGLETRACDVASRVLNKTCCSSWSWLNGPPKECNIGGHVERVLDSFGISYKRLPARPEFLIEALRRGRVAMIRFKNADDPSQPGHVVIARGVSGAENPLRADFLIEDSGAGNTYRTGAQLLYSVYDVTQGSFRGTWDYTLIAD